MAIGHNFVIRGLLLLVALAACAWFAIGIRQAHDAARASAIVPSSPPLSATLANRALSSLHAASFLNPDTQVDLLRAQVAIDRGERTQAESIVLGVVRKEPMNAQAWFLLATFPTNRATTDRALAEVARLVPRVSLSP